MTQVVPFLAGMFTAWLIYLLAVFRGWRGFSPIVRITTGGAGAPLSLDLKTRTVRVNHEAYRSIQA